MAKVTWCENNPVYSRYIPGTINNFNISYPSKIIYINAETRFSKSQRWKSFKNKKMFLRYYEVIYTYICIIMKLKYKYCKKKKKE